MTEDQLEQETLGWLADVGYRHVYGPDIAVDGATPERSNYTQVILLERLRAAIARLNPIGAFSCARRRFAAGFKFRYASAVVGQSPVSSLAD